MAAHVEAKRAACTFMTSGSTTKTCENWYSAILV
jgi:hypothetical protein